MNESFPNLLFYELKKALMRQQNAQIQCLISHINSSCLAILVLISLYTFLQINMHNDIEQLVNQNLSLRKSYQLAKSQLQNMQRELKETKQKHRDLNESYINLSQQNKKLIDKNKSLQAHINNNNASFVSQIEELKSLIEQKENEMEDFQLKMIPSLDQDMIRVKLIAEMEGPYQQVVDKKDRQISRLKDQIHQLKRQKQIAEFSLANKQTDFKRQIEEVKNFYEQEADRLSRQLTHFNQKTTTGKMQKDIIRSYRQEIDQLRSSCEFHRNTEEELRKQLGNLRFERQKLLADLLNANAQKAIQFKEANNDVGLKQLKLAKARIEDQLQSTQRELERSKSRIKSLEQEKGKITQKYEWQLKDKTTQWQQQRQKHRNQMSEYKDEIRKLRQINHRIDQQRQDISQKYKSTINSNQKLTQQISTLKIKLNMQQSQQMSRFRRGEEIDRVSRERIERQTIERMEKQLRIKIRQEISEQERRHSFKGQFEKLYKILAEKVDKETLANFVKQLKRKIKAEVEQQYRRHGESPKRQVQPEQKKSDKQKIRVLEEKVKKLTQKLQFANRKILQLLKEKARRLDTRENIELTRTRTNSYSPEHDYHKLLLDNRDCSFVPMCPPVIVEHLQAKKDYFMNF